MWKLGKMIYKLVLPVLAALALKSISALVCHDYACDGTRCFGKGTTCDSGNNPCQVLKVSAYGTETTTYTCSAFSSCQSYVSNTTSDGMTISMCCNTDLCNDGLSGSPMEENEQYCYTIGCEGAGCVAELSTYVDEQNLGAYCKATEFGCELTTLKQRNPETGKMIVEEASLCATSACFPVNQELDGINVKIDCCTGHLCNKDHGQTDTDKDYCYVYSCMSPPCLPVKEAAENGMATLCEMGPKGCYYSNTNYKTENRNIVVSGCVDLSPELDECVSSSAAFEDIETTTTCCQSDKCNDGTANTDDKELDPNKEYCHLYECVSASCWSLADAVQLGKTSLCEMTSLGCYANAVTTLDGMVIDAGCVGKSPAFETCIPTSADYEGTRITTTCCKNDRCNDKIADDKAEDNLDPAKNYCHVYSCIGSTADKCKPLSEMVQQKQTSYCEMSEKGCFESIFATNNQYSFLAGCAGDLDMADECEEAAHFYDDTETIQKCCDTDRCNDGVQMSVDTDIKPFCHMYTCESSPSTQCMSLVDAIIMGKTVKCERTEKGCYVMSSKNAVSAGCLGDEYDMSDCPQAPSGEDASVVCCNSDGCNDGLESGSDLDSDTDSGLDSAASVKARVSITLLALFSMCVCMFI